MRLWFLILLIFTMSLKKCLITFLFFVKYRPWFVTGNGNNNIPIYTAFQVNGRISDSIGVARVLRLGGQMSTMSTYPLSKTENSSDLVHYFFGRGPKLTFKNKNKNTIKMSCLGGPMAGLKDP